jgi:hypothetical protein
MIKEDEICMCCEEFQDCDPEITNVTCKNFKPMSLCDTCDVKINFKACHFKPKAEVKECNLYAFEGTLISMEDISGLPLISVLKMTPDLAYYDDKLNEEFEEKYGDSVIKFFPKT